MCMFFFGIFCFVPDGRWVLAFFHFPVCILFTWISEKEGECHGKLGELFLTWGPVFLVAEAGEWAHEIHNGTSSHHASTHHPHAPHVHPSDQMSPSNGNGEDRYSCPRCGRGYKWKQTVTRHLRYECGVDPQFACPICNSLFRHKVVLMRHMKRHANLMWWLRAAFVCWSLDKLIRSQLQPLKGQRMTLSCVAGLY